jgi:hypothetical protein
VPRYFFHLKSAKTPVQDRCGVELSGLAATHWHATRLVYRLREHAAEAGEDWVVEVAEASGRVPLVLLPSSVPMLRIAGTEAAKIVVVRVKPKYAPLTKEAQP